MTVLKLDECERAGRFLGYYIRTKLNAGCQPRGGTFWTPISPDEIHVVVELDIDNIAGRKKPPVICPAVPELNGCDGVATVAELEPYLFDKDIDLAIVYHADIAVLIAAPLSHVCVMCSQGDRYMRLDAFEVRYAVENAKRERGGGDERSRDGRGGGDDD